MAYQIPTPAPGEHDTTALPLPPAAVPAGATTGGYASGYGYGGAYAQAAGDAAYWEGRYRKERTRKRILLVTAVLTGMLAIGLGITAWGLAQTNPLVSAATDLADRLDGDSTDSQPDAIAPDGTSPDTTAPDSTTPDDAEGDGSAQDLQLPESLRDLGSALGITDVDQLIDMAESAGLLTQEQADQLRAALSAGAAGSGQAG
ncbi:MAG: hypothetical protein WCF04_09305 [Candidatus Nanopelagicales bacterium]